MYKHIYIHIYMQLLYFFKTKVYHGETYKEKDLYKINPCPLIFDAVLKGCKLSIR